MITHLFFSLAAKLQENILHLTSLIQNYLSGSPTIFLWATQIHYGAKASLLPVASQPPPKTWWWYCPQPPIIFFYKFFSSLGLRAQSSTVFLGSHSLSLFSAIFLSWKVNIQNVDTIYICNSNFFQGLRSTLVITHKTFLYGHSCRELKNKQTQDIQAATFTLPKGESPH